MKYKKSWLVIIAAVLFSGCAAYKQLQPEPEINFIEDGYFELKDDKDFFELKENKKYYMEFPGPVAENIYLVIKAEPKQLINHYLTLEFKDDKKGPFRKMDDQSLNPANHSAYALDPTTPFYFWVIDTVKRDLILDADYRYVAGWRYKFENSYAQFLREFEENMLSRDTFKALGVTIQSDQVDLENELNKVRAKISRLESINTKLAEIESIFPPDIKNSNDAAYLDYTELSINLENELIFQKKYANLLEILNIERETRGNAAAFSAELGKFREYLSQTDDLKQSAKDEICRVFSPRLNETLRYFENEIRDKRDRKRIDLNTADLEKLYVLCKKNVSEELRAMALFIDNYNKKTDALSYSSSQFEQLQRDIEAKKNWPTNSFYIDIQNTLRRIKREMPSRSTASFGKYKSYRCSTLLEAAITALYNEILRSEKQYEQAAQTVNQINILRQKSDYGSIIQLLNRKKLPFLYNHYSDIDNMSLQAQSSAIKSAIEKNNFASAENRLRNLFNDRNFINYNAIQSDKNYTVKKLENLLLSRIEETSRNRISGFINQNLETTTNVAQLYDDPVFLPAHNMKFNSRFNSNLASRQQNLVQKMRNFKESVFPAKAIENLYQKFTRNLNKNAVPRAKAIITHGKFYKGNDNKIKNLIAECDPMLAKKITKAADYRRIFVIPQTDNTSGSNDYIFRLNIQIPSDAKFPVYDINIKLPADIARNAVNNQWYETISIDGKIIKNEGRFTITAPTADNNYECQVTPVRVTNGQDNIFEVRFKHNSYRAYEVSIMAQRPIIRKN